jgi:hypothetical protein
MADEADIAFDTEQRNLSQALAVQRARHVRMQPTGECHHCGNQEGLGDRLFCDSDCAEDWEYEHALRRKLGLGAGTLLH